MWTGVLSDFIFYSITPFLDIYKYKKRNPMAFFTHSSILQYDTDTYFISESKKYVY